MCDVERLQETSSFDMPMNSNTPAALEVHLAHSQRSRHAAFCRVSVWS